MISVIIPHCPLNDELNTLLEECVKSLNDYQELIIVVNEGIGFAKAVNQGLRLAKGDYIMVVNNDIKLISGSLKDLCDPTAVTSPIVNEGSQPFWGCFFCLPKWIYEKVGGLDEQFETGFYEDDDYIKRLTREGIPMLSKSVRIKTTGGNTMKHFPDKSKENKSKFEQKYAIT